MSIIRIAEIVADGLQSTAARLRAEASTWGDGGTPPPGPTPTGGPRPPTPPASRCAGRHQAVDARHGRARRRTSKWPDTPTEMYDPFSVYETEDASTASCVSGSATQSPAAVARAQQQRPYAVTFEVDGTERRRPLVVFTATDDHATTGDFVGIVQGRGSSRNDMFAPTDTLPPEYAGFEIVTFKDHVSRRYSYNKLAVIARGRDVDPILDHALIQLRTR